MFTTTTAKRSEYRFERFRLAHMLADMRFGRASRRPGETLPERRLVRTDGTEVRLRDFAHGRPLVLVTGSLSCPVTAAFVPRLAQLEERFGDQLAFALVYVREAHPGENIPQPETMDEKIANARALQAAEGVNWPVLVDDLDGALHTDLDREPNSLHVVAPHGTILFRALFANDPATDAALERIAAGERPRKGTASAFLRPALGSLLHVHDVLTAAGRRAYLDVLRVAPPMALLGFLLHALRPRRRSAGSPAVETR